MNLHWLDMLTESHRPLHSVRRRIDAVPRLAFSLVEVVIAMAIAAVGIVSILGLLPHSLETIKKTGNLTSEARIMQKIAGEYNLGGWTEGAGATTVYQYFDDQGIEVERSDPGFENRFVYVVRLDVPALNLSLPSAGGAGAIEQNLRRVIVKIAAVPVLDFNFDAAAANTYQTYTLLVAKMKLRST
jgi:uncharacterized protein (TIGR02598 family)